MNTTPLPAHHAASFLKRLMEVQWRKPGVGNPQHPTTWVISRDGLVPDNDPDGEEDED